MAQGCSLGGIGLQPRWHRAAAWITHTHATHGCRCVLGGAGLGGGVVKRGGESRHLMLTTYDLYGNRCTEGGAEVTLYVTWLSPPRQPVHRGDALYEAAIYLPCMLPGYHP